jgi:hypothetical protein
MSNTVPRYSSPEIRFVAAVFDVDESYSPILILEMLEIRGFLAARK